MGVLITKYERGAVIFERAVKVDLRAGDKAVAVSGTPVILPINSGLEEKCVR